MRSASSRRFALISAISAVSTLLCSGIAGAREIRICADPNNLPFSDNKGEGFENKIAVIIAREIGAKPQFVWAPLWRGFVRKTLEAGLCDVLPGVPQKLERVRTTQAYYVASYVLLQRADAPPISSLDDPSLKTLKIGVQLVGDDGANTPPMDALAKRGIVDNIRGFMAIGDWSKPNPLEPIVDAVSNKDVDLAMVWGPIAGYYAQTAAVPLRVTPIPPDPGAHLSFAISMAVRKHDEALADEINDALKRRHDDIQEILDSFGVPRLQIASTAPEVTP